MRLTRGKVYIFYHSNLKSEFKIIIKIPFTSKKIKNYIILNIFLYAPKMSKMVLDLDKGEKIEFLFILAGSKNWRKNFFWPILG